MARIYWGQMQPGHIEEVQKWKTRACYLYVILMQSGSKHIYRFDDGRILIKDVLGFKREMGLRSCESIALFMRCLLAMGVAEEAFMGTSYFWIKFKKGPEGRWPAEFFPTSAAEVGDFNYDQ